MFRVYEAINNTGKKFKEHGSFDDISDARNLAWKLWGEVPSSTFVVNYKNDTGFITEEYFGNWSN